MGQVDGQNELTGMAGKHGQTPRRSSSPSLPLIGLWVQFLRRPYRILFPLILRLAVVGTYSANLNIFDVWVMIAFGVVGYLLVKLGYELAPSSWPWCWGRYSSSRCGSR
jgi:hypothetical protein